MKNHEDLVSMGFRGEEVQKLLRLDAFNRKVIAFEQAHRMAQHSRSPFQFGFYEGYTVRISLELDDNQKHEELEKRFNPDALDDVDTEQDFIARLIRKSFLSEFETPDSVSGHQKFSWLRFGHRDGNSRFWLTRCPKSPNLYLVRSETLEDGQSSRIAEHIMASPSQEELIQTLYTKGLSVPIMQLPL